MTIAQATELYNEVCDKIKRIEELMQGIFLNQGYSLQVHQNVYYVPVQEMKEISDFLTEYKTYLRKQLDATFEPDDTGNG